MVNAGTEKYRLEEMQRSERKEREVKSESWVPRWFRKMDSLDLFPGDYSCCYCYCYFGTCRPKGANQSSSSSFGIGSINQQ